jgi:hypothetical protein
MQVQEIGALDSALESGVRSTLLWVLEEPESRGGKLLNPYYKLLAGSAHDGQLEVTLRCFRGLAKMKDKQDG